LLEPKTRRKRERFIILIKKLGNFSFSHNRGSQFCSGFEYRISVCCVSLWLFRFEVGCCDLDWNSVYKRVSICQNIQPVVQFGTMSSKNPTKFCHIIQKWWIDQRWRFKIKYYLRIFKILFLFGVKNMSNTKDEYFQHQANAKKRLEKYWKFSELCWKIIFWSAILDRSFKSGRYDKIYLYVMSLVKM
jgi:hypothetical protein